MYQKNSRSCSVCIFALLYSLAKYNHNTFLYVGIAMRYTLFFPHTFLFATLLLSSSIAVAADANNDAFAPVAAFQEAIRQHTISPHATAAAVHTMHTTSPWELLQLQPKPSMITDHGEGEFSVAQQLVAERICPWNY
jgi:hypothetical protein